jgi:hypothetical protein
MTGEARAALGDKPEVRISGFPFNVGRESRVGAIDKLKSAIERRLGRATQLNHLYLIEPLSQPLHISREHFAILHLNGGYVVVDRASTCGLRVSGKEVGGDAAVSHADIKDGDLIVVGAAQSPYVFRFEVRARQ